MAPKASKNAFLRVFLSLILILLAGTAVLYYFLTVELHPPRSGKLNKLDSKEAARKIKLIHEAFLTGKKGFIRLTDVELNSYLKDNVHLASPVTNEIPVLRLCQVQFGRGEFTSYSYVQRPVLGKAIEFVWQRHIIMDSAGDPKKMRLASMKVGDVPIPEKLWPQVNSVFDGVDPSLIKQYDWFPKLPAVYLTNNDANDSLELRLYSVKP